MPLQTILICAFAIVVFGSLMAVLVPIALRPGKEAQRAFEVINRQSPRRTFRDRKESILAGMLALVQKIRSKLRVVKSERLTRKLAMAGYWHANAADFYFAAQVSFPVLLAWVGGLAQQDRLLWMCLCAVLGLLLPDLWVSHTIRKRKELIRRALPDAIDLLVICVDAGLGLDQAVIRTGDELIRTHPELYEELHRVHLEQRAGRPRLEAWQNLAERTDLPELASFVSLLVQSDRFGTQVTKALGVVADDIRLKHRQRAEEATAKLKIKILFPLIFFIFPCLLIVILGPAVLNISKDLHELIK